MAKSVLRYAGTDWLSGRLKNQKKPRSISKFGRLVADILGQVYQGIYHVDEAVLSDRVDWSDEAEIAVSVYSGLGTFDFPELTILFLTCIHKGISCQIRGSFKGYTKLVFLNEASSFSLDKLPLSEEVLKTIADNTSGDAFGLTRLMLSTDKSKLLWEYPDKPAVEFTRSMLTMESLGLVVGLAHLHYIRIEVRGRSPRTLELLMHQRSPSGSVSERHPGWEEAIELWKPYWNI